MMRDDGVSQAADQAVDVVSDVVIRQLASTQATEAFAVGLIIFSFLQTKNAVQLNVIVVLICPSCYRSRVQPWNRKLGNM